MTLELAVESGSVASFKDSISRYVAGYTGHSEVQVKFNGWSLEISCGLGQLLIYDLRNYKEVYGQIRKVGFAMEDIEVIRRAVCRIIQKLVAIYKHRRG